jgi:hypothetical protein
MSKIENNHQLQVSRNAIKRLKRALKGYEVHDPADKSGCLESLRIGIRQIEAEIATYLAAQTTDASEELAQARVASG